MLVYSIVVTLILVLLGFGGIGILFFNLYSNYKREKQLKNKLNNDNNNDCVIKYDLNDSKQYVKSSVLCLFEFVAFILIDKRMLDVTFWAIVILLQLIVILIGIISLIKLFVANTYIRGLEAKQIIVPENKDEYEASMEKLLDKSGVMIEEDTDTKRDGSSLFAMYASIVVFIFCAIYNLMFPRIHYNFGPSANDVMVILFYLDIFWIISACFFYYQSDNRRYKNANQVSFKKNRMTIPAKIVYFIVFVHITIFTKSAFYSLSHFMFKSDLSINAQYEDFIRHTFNSITETYGGIPEDVMNDLEKGVDISTWENDCEYKDMILNDLDLDSFEDIRKNIRIPDGEPKVIVTYENETFIVKFENVFGI